MKRLILLGLIILTTVCGVYYLNQYWIHRYDGLIKRQAGIYRLDPDLVWSIIYEETYFSPWKAGQAGEVGLMQVTRAVGQDWAAETGMRELERQMAADPSSLLRDPERNIQIGCWYLEKFYEQYRDTPDAEARVIAAYNAGPSRAAEWNRPREGGAALSEEEFIQRIDIPSTRAYVTSILGRYRKLKDPRSHGAATVQRPVTPSRAQDSITGEASGSMGRVSAELTRQAHPKKDAPLFGVRRLVAAFLRGGLTPRLI